LLARIVGEDCAGAIGIGSKYTPTQCRHPGKSIVRANFDLCNPYTGRISNFL
jgi:hypothetical protein